MTAATKPRKRTAKAKVPATVKKKRSAAIKLCSGRKKDGSPCGNPPMRGRDVCKPHSKDADVGRRTKFTPQVRKKILEGAKAGMWRKDAAAYAGVSREALHDWLEIADKQEMAGLSETDSAFIHFSHDLAIAEAQHKFGLVGRITAASIKDWKAAAWLLERKHPDEYGRKDAKVIEHMGSVGLEHTLGGRQPVDVPIETREKIIALLEQAMGEDDVIEGTAIEE